MQRALADAAAVAASLVQVAKRAAVIQSESYASRSAVNASRTASRPWPTQGASSASAPAALSAQAHGSSRPWPTQAASDQGHAFAEDERLAATTSSATAAPPTPSYVKPDPASRPFDLPPLAPDGTPTEMKVVHRGASASEATADQSQKSILDMDEEERAEALRKLDESLGAYFGHEQEAPEESPSSAPVGAQVSQTTVKESSGSLPRNEHEAATSPPVPEFKSGPPPDVTKSSQLHNSSAAFTQGHTPDKIEPSTTQQGRPGDEGMSMVDTDASREDDAVPTTLVESETLQGTDLPDEYDAATEPRSVPLRAAKVPSSRIGRLFHYGSLGAGLAWGTAGQYLSGSQDGQQRSAFMSDANIARLVDKLSTMRGAALKLGQFMSIQDSNMLPEQIEQVMLRVQNSANYMPAWQMEKVMTADLGSDWRSHFSEFANVPFAAASIGQVHSATLSPSSSHPLAGKRVAVKVQFPGVAESISSDLANLRWLVTASALLPKGLFLDNTIRVMRSELADECDYIREASMCRKFGEELKDSSVFAVPRTVDELCSSRVLTTEMMRGRPLTQAARLSQDKRNEIAKSILSLSLHELFSWRLMQTDPNWTNFLYNERTRKIELIDFGATREYSKEFMDGWLSLLRSAVAGDRDECQLWSQRVGYLTGEESEPMVSAHVDSMLALAEPFRADAPEPYPFANQTITDRVRAQIPLMLRERLTPPPPETYSLNRKLSGAFLLCARLKAEVSCRTMLEEITGDYTMGPEESPSAMHGTIAASALGFGGQKRALHTSSVARSAQSHPLTAALPPAPSHTSYRPASRDLSNRWPRYATVVEALTGTNSSSDSDLTLSPPPASASMSYTPSDATSPQGTTSAAEKVDAESKSTAEPPPPDIFIRGVRVPGKPNPPGSEDCCMSGCAHCVYDLYAEDLEYYLDAIGAARKALLVLKPPISEAEWDETRLGTFPEAKSVSEATEDSNQMQKEAKSKAGDEVDRAIEGLDPSMRAFLQLQRKLKSKG